MLALLLSVVMKNSAGSTEYANISQKRGLYLPIQADYVKLGECTLSLDKWAQGLAVKLLKITYQNVHVHNAVTGVAATARKEEIQQFIENQIELGEEGLETSD